MGLQISSLMLRLELKLEQGCGWGERNNRSNPWERSKLTGQNVFGTQILQPFFWITTENEWNSRYKLLNWCSVYTIKEEKQNQKTSEEGSDLDLPITYLKQCNKEKERIGCPSELRVEEPWEEGEHIIFGCADDRNRVQAKAEGWRERETREKNKYLDFSYYFTGNEFNTS